jgi:hypothetical protein
MKLNFAQDYADIIKERFTEWPFDFKGLEGKNLIDRLLRFNQF